MAGQIIPRGPNKWLIKADFGRDPNTRKRNVRSRIVRGTKKDAERELTKFLRERDTGTFVEPSRQTVNAYLDEWLNTSATLRVRANTLMSYRKMLKSYIRPTLGARRLDQLSPQDIQRTIAGLQAQGLEARTIRYAVGVLSTSLRQAVRFGTLVSNPAERVDLPPLVRREMHALSPEEASRFLAAVAADRWGVLFAFAIATGMRPSEVLGLKWKDVDLDKGTVFVRQALTRKPGGRHLTAPKTKGSKRRIPIPAGLVAQLREHRAEQDAERTRAGDRYDDQDFVFAGPTGKPVSERTLAQRHFKPALEAAGLPQTIRFYDLRHTCATMLLAANINAKVVAERLGHSTIVLTMDTYSHVLPSMQQQAADALDGMLFRDQYDPPP